MNSTTAIKVELLAEQLERDGEYLQTLLLQENADTQDYQQLITPYIQNSRNVCALLAESSEYKRCFFVARKTYKIIAQIIKAYLPFSDQKIFNLQAVVELTDSSNAYSQSESEQAIRSLLQQPNDIQTKKLPQKHITQLEIASKAHSAVIASLNNQGVIYMMRGKADTALGCFLKAAQLRVEFISYHTQAFQCALLCMNIAFCFKASNELAQASQLINKAILMLESLEKINKDSNGESSVSESVCEFLCLVEMQYNKGEKDYAMNEIDQTQRLIYLLSISYNFYADILAGQNKNKEGDFCKKQSELLFSQFLKKLQASRNRNNNYNKNNDSSPASAALTSKNINKLFTNGENTNNNKQQVVPSSQQQKYKQQQQMDDNFSHASFQSVNTTQSLGAFGGQVISKEDIIFSKYIKVSEVRYKLVILQIKEYTCVQLILYNKPNGFLQKIVIGFPALIEYSNALMMPTAFASQDGLNAFFIEVSRKLQIEKGMLKIRDLEYYQSIEDFVRFAKILPPNFSSNSNSKVSK